MAKKPYDWKKGATLQEHSKRKHKILGEYFRRYLWERCKNPHTRHFNLAIVDAFAGGGHYADGSPGSPVIFAKTLLDTVANINLKRAEKNMPKVEINCLMILNDSDPDAYRKLIEAVAPHEAAAREADSNVILLCKFYHGKFEALVDKFCTLIKSERYRNVIYNLDQCGHGQVDRATIFKLISSERSVEIFFTYAIKSLIAFLDQRNSQRNRNRLRYLDLRANALELAENQMTKNEWLGGVERDVFDHFHECAPFVTPFSINNPDGWRYWFMHFAKSYRARQIYNDVLHKNSSEQAHFGRSGLHMLSYDPNHDRGFLYLFNSEAREEANRRLYDDIPRLVSCHDDAIKISDFYNLIYNDTPAHSDDIHDAIFKNFDLEVLTPKGNRRRFARRISLNDTLRRREQLSFHIPEPKKDRSK